MVNKKVFECLNKYGLEKRITIHSESIDTVEHAALSIGCSEAEIAKTLSSVVDDSPVIVVMAGDGRVNSSKFKAQFHTKPHMVPGDEFTSVMLTPDELEKASGAVGWCDVCKGWEYWLANDNQYL